MPRSREGAATNEAQRRRFIGIPSSSSISPSSLYLVVRRSQLKFHVRAGYAGPLMLMLMHDDQHDRRSAAASAWQPRSRFNQPPWPIAFGSRALCSLAPSQVVVVVRGRIPFPFVGRRACSWPGAVGSNVAPGPGSSPRPSSSCSSTSWISKCSRHGPL
jgi:hypothetical protein